MSHRGLRCLVQVALSEVKTKMMSSLITQAKPHLLDPLHSYSFPASLYALVFNAKVVKLLGRVYHQKACDQIMHQS